MGGTFGVDPATFERWVREGLVRTESARPKREARPLSVTETRLALLQKAREEQRPAAIRVFWEVHVKPRGHSLMAFGASPSFDGMESEARQWARDFSLKWKLPVFEVQHANVDLLGRSKEFTEPGIYLRPVVYDEQDPAETRCFRYF